jgi:pimeloyl-ACP methyl ester carboxylesterase
MMPSTTERVIVDGATLAVEQVGAGTSGLVYIPGWCCSRRDFLPVAQEMAGRASLMIDLPGQGESTSERRHWSMAQFGTAIADVVRRRRWDNVVLIGHSLGGAVAIEAAIALGSTALQVICLDALVYESFYAKQTEAFILDTLRPIEEDFAGFMQSLVHALFVDKDSALIDTVARTMAAAPVREALESQRTLLEWDRDEVITRCPVPIDVLAARAFLDPAVVDRLRPAVRVTPLDLGGHFFLLEEPLETARAIEKLLREERP